MNLLIKYYILIFYLNKLIIKKILVLTIVSLALFNLFLKLSRLNGLHIIVNKYFLLQIIIIIFYLISIVQPESLVIILNNF
jgi:hypothetical protein